MFEVDDSYAENKRRGTSMPGVMPRSGNYHTTDRRVLMLRFTNRRLFRLALRFWKELEAERDKTAKLTTENKRMRAAIEDALLDAEPTKFPYDRLASALTHEKG